MLTKFWEAVGGKLADRWVAVSVPALVFWSGGVLAWLYDRGSAAALQQPLDWLGQQTAPMQIGILVLALFATVASGEVVAELTTPTLKLLEGYWPKALEPIRGIVINHVKTKVENLDDRLQQLAGPVNENTATRQQREEYVRVDRNLRRYPASGDYQPTRVGNALRAAESRPEEKYGLDAVTVWPHLWLLLPTATQNELSAARRSLDSAVATCLWAGLFLMFTPWAWWAAPLGLAVALAAYRVRVIPRAEVFADLVEAAFDLYRTALYSQLRWPLPTNPRSERAEGRSVTEYLWRGFDSDLPVFTTPATKK